MIDSISCGQTVTGSAAWARSRTPAPGQPGALVAAWPACALRAAPRWRAALSAVGVAFRRANGPAG